MVLPCNESLLDADRFMHYNSYGFIAKARLIRQKETDKQKGFILYTIEE